MLFTCYDNFFYVHTVQEMTTIVKDFILVGEFCEVSGPQAVLTIPGQISSQPTHLNNNKCFNLDEFLLYIMTTDYQNFQG